VIVAGASVSRDGVMRFGARLPNDTATLLLMAVFIIVLLGLSAQTADRASQHAVAISIIGAVCLLGVYGAWLYSYLRLAGSQETHDAPAEAASHSLRFGIALLALSGAGAALVSDWFVAALDPAVRALGISKAFTGLVIVAIAGNAVENVVGISLALKGRPDFAVSLVKNSVSQIAVFLFPVLVLLSLFFDPSLTFVLDPIWIGALTLMALAVWQITGDGEAALFEGLALVSLYVILATVAWFE
jgi:Ca2+:H+ antiporter